MRRRPLAGARGTLPQWGGARIHLRARFFSLMAPITFTPGRKARRHSSGDRWAAPARKLPDGPARGFGGTAGQGREDPDAAVTIEV
eukprot:scaffold16470_cov120-Isochrysis_galbana.AAC.9